MRTNETPTDIPSDSVSVTSRNQGTFRDFTKDIRPMTDSQRDQEYSSQLPPKLQSEEDYCDLIPIEPEQANYLENLRNEFRDMPVMMFYNIVRLWHVQQELPETQD